MTGNQKTGNVIFNLGSRVQLYAIGEAGEENEIKVTALRSARGRPYDYGGLHVRPVGEDESTYLDVQTPGKITISMLKPTDNAIFMDAQSMAGTGMVVLRMRYDVNMVDPVEKSLPEFESTMRSVLDLTGGEPEKAPSKITLQGTAFNPQYFHAYLASTQLGDIEAKTNVDALIDATDEVGFKKLTITEARVRIAGSSVVGETLDVKAGDSGPSSDVSITATSEKGVELNGKDVKKRGPHYQLERFFAFPNGSQDSRCRRF